MAKMFPVQIKGQPHGFILVEAGATAGGGGELSSLDDVDVTGLADGFILKWDAGTSTWIVAAESGGGGGGVTDHGALTGLADDDHPQYHNNARGDARYSLLGHNHTSSAITDFPASTRGQVEAMLLAGANVTLTPAGSGASRTLTISASGGGGGGGSGNNYIPGGW